jgi:two-component system, NarL family, nitrate/nitrite response regulator NarL
MTMKPIRLMVVDDHTLFRRGLVSLLAGDDSLQVVGEAGDAGDALRQVGAQVPDVILLDNHLPGVRGIDALPGLKEAAPCARILLLTVSEDEQDLAAALRAGAQGYLLKSIDGDQLVDAIHRAMKGEAVISPEMTAKLATAFQNASGTTTAGDDVAAQLSPREQQVLQEIARGASNKEIARTLEIAETTVKIHVQHILRKLGLSSRVQAAVYATERA